MATIPRNLLRSILATNKPQGLVWPFFFNQGPRPHKFYLMKNTKKTPKMTTKKTTQKSARVRKSADDKNQAYYHELIKLATDNHLVEDFDKVTKLKTFMNSLDLSDRRENKFYPGIIKLANILVEIDKLMNLAVVVEIKTNEKLMAEKTKREAVAQRQTARLEQKAVKLKKADELAKAKKLKPSAKQPTKATKKATAPKKAKTTAKVKKTTTAKKTAK